MLKVAPIKEKPRIAGVIEFVH